jgi:hypothetical protein
MDGTMESWKDKVGKNKKLERGLYMNDHINNFYIRSLEGLPRIQNMLKDLDEECRKNGRDYLEDLSAEIILMKALIRDAVEDYNRVLARDDENPRAKRACISEIDRLTRSCARLKQSAHNMKHAPKYTVPITEVKMMMSFVQQVVMHRVKDRVALKHIADDFTTLCEPRSIEISELNSEASPLSSDPNT